MAESNQMLLDTKLDLKDGKCELYYLKSWVKCFVKIEAIQCFPCYLKISFFYHDDDHNKDDPLAVIRINIPGVRVDTAASRTKALAYGLFWKNNRKRCKLFFAFTEKAKYIEHMGWLKHAIDSLEEYRKQILENHRMSRSVVENKTDDDKITSNGISDGNKKTNKSRIAQNRDLNDVLGPLPAIPSPNLDDSSRWSIRRVSGCSGIYEEILDPPLNDSQSNTSRKSVASGIYVDMTTPIQRIGIENSETPPPLPPRTRLTQNAYTDITVYAAKSKKSAWNLMNVFGRSKMATETAPISTNSNANLIAKREKIDADALYAKQRNVSIMAKSRSENLNIDLLASKHTSFSTPDLTNIVDISQPPNDDADDADLDIMDIERSNSLNCSANQFLSRPPTLNISSNILWSHNLTSTLLPNFNSSAINLVGADVNSNSILREDLSGYCQMAPIIRNKLPPPIEQKSPAKTRPDHGQDTVDACGANRLIENASGYCQMAPIINQVNATEPMATHKVDLIKNITFARKYEMEEDSFSLLEFSLLSNDKHSSHRGSNEENSSSGVSSDEGIIYTTTSLNSTPLDDTHSNHMTENIENDDAVSIAWTESSTNPSPLNTTLPFHTTKFDEKYPSYFPNTNCTSSSSSPTLVCTNRQSANNQNELVPRKPLYERQKAKCIEATPQTSDSSPSTPHINYMKTNYKTVIKSTPAKVQKTKQRKTSDYDFVGTPIAAIVPGDENRCSYHRKEKNFKNSEICKFKIHHSNVQNPKQKIAIDTKNVLTNADGNAKSHSFDKNVKMQKQSSSPRGSIYNKCATLATRLKTPPTTPTIGTHVDSIEFNCSRNGGFSTLPSISKKFSFDVAVDCTNSSESTAGNKDGIGLLRFASLSRFRKIDFSPLKLKINNILQRPNIGI